MKENDVKEFLNSQNISFSKQSTMRLKFERVLLDVHGIKKIYLLYYWECLHQRFREIICF